MSITQAFNEITIAQGGTPSKGAAITAAIDALNDALAGSDQPTEQTIEAAVRLLGEHIGGGGSSVTVEALTATENKTYTAPAGKAYSPVTVNVSGAAQEYDIECYDTTYAKVSSFAYAATITGGGDVPYDLSVDTSANINKAVAGSLVAISWDEIAQDYGEEENVFAINARQDNQADLNFFEIPSVSYNGYFVFTMPNQTAYVYVNHWA